MYRNSGLSKGQNLNATSLIQEVRESLAGLSSLCFLDGVLSQVLQDVNLPILTQEECEAALLTLKKPVSGQTFLCTGFPDGGKDACQVGGSGQAERSPEGFPSALSSGESLKEGCRQNWILVRSDKRGQVKIKGHFYNLVLLGSVNSEEVFSFFQKTN